MSKRTSGVLLHITSLPGVEGIGTLGQEAFRFVDFLVEAKQQIWQILPLGPVGYGNSPYQCYSAFAGNPMLIDLQFLVKEELLSSDDLANIPKFIKKRVGFDNVEKWKMPVLKTAFINFQNKYFGKFRDAYYSFLDEHAWWLNDYAFFMAVRLHFEGVAWGEWEDGIKFRKNESMRKLGKKLSKEIDFEKFLQFHFFRQWFRLKEYANSKGVQIVGDLPLYVSGDSADIWSNTDIFMLDRELKATEVGGVPPDYFSEAGQLWGNPVYNWPRIKERNFDWWIARLHFNVNMFNLVRIDHFRGLESFWSVPAGEENAVNGKWVPAYGHELLKMFKGQVGRLPLIAEDLGHITPEVDKLREDFALPGMKVLQFAFTDDAANVDLPHNYSKNFVVYTGTHDNSTSLGWLTEIEGEEKAQVKKYINLNENRGVKELIEMAMSSVARTAVIPMQDILELDSESRMNIPGTAAGNWEWRFQWRQLTKSRKLFLQELTEKYNR